MPRLAATILCLAALAPTGAGQAANPVFRISIDRDSWRQFGWRYPATYVFQLSGEVQELTASRRDGLGDFWTPLAPKPPGESLNGAEGFRVDPETRRAYVSAGFKSLPTIYLTFSGAKQVEFVEIARYYDGRKAACSLSIDNWGFRAKTNPGAPWKGADDDQSDNYQAALAVCRSYDLPVSIAINTRGAGGDAFWETLQAELDRGDRSWEPAVHAQTHPCKASAYLVRGYRNEILGCRDELLARLRNIPWGQHIFEHILTCGYYDDSVLATSAGQFVLVRGYNSRDNPTSVDYASWNTEHGFYGVGGLSYKAYDAVFQRRQPAGRYYREDVEALNAAFDEVHRAGQIFYAMWHPDRYQNSVIHDVRPPIEGVQGSSLVQHLEHLARRTDVWYVANGWLHCYRYVAENARVERQP
ncbi:MAG: hypothetical protein RBS80_21255 [Thermoguttaceae bacterium]|jgi:hypothetical protein|nr:hypothetical protein [Thermoguttaceae bacterium]